MRVTVLRLCDCKSSWAGLAAGTAGLFTSAELRVRRRTRPGWRPPAALAADVAPLLLTWRRCC